MSTSEITLTRDRVDTRVLAQHLGNQHENVMRLAKDYRADFEQFGILRFTTGEIRGRGQPEKFALLNEDQCYLLLSFSRNTARVRALKVRLVRAFADARKAAAIRQAEYLPAYHELHDAIKAAAGGSPNERWMHINANRALNKLAGIDAGQRHSAGAMTQSLLSVGSLLAARAVLKASCHREIQTSIKLALEPLASALQLEALQ